VVAAGWRSSDSTVASVSAAGLVTPLANGSALITATFQGVTGSMALTILAPSTPSPPSPPPSPPGPAPQTYTLAGVVRASDVIIAADTTRDLVMDRNRVTLTGIARDAPPCSGLAIDSALVQVLDGPDAGKSSLTDRSGFEYSIAGVAWGAFRVRASRDDVPVRRSSTGDPADAGECTPRGDSHRPRVEGRLYLRRSHPQRQGSGLFLELRPSPAVVPTILATPLSRHHQRV
jgi:hypothetical protein